MPWDIDPDNPHLTYDEIDDYIDDYNAIAAESQKKG